jgi:hypothetical protein
MQNAATNLLQWTGSNPAIKGKRAKSSRQANGLFKPSAAAAHRLASRTAFAQSALDSTIAIQISILKLVVDNVCTKKVPYGSSLSVVRLSELDAVSPDTVSAITVGRLLFDYLEGSHFSAQDRFWPKSLCE